MSGIPHQVRTTAEAISAERLKGITPLGTNDGYIARFAGSDELRCFGQNLIDHGDDTFSLLILPCGRIPEEGEASRILSPSLDHPEEITATVQLIYNCPMEASLAAQSDMIHGDLSRLLDHDSTIEAQCCGFTITHVAPEAETYGNIESGNVPQIQADRMRDALAGLYLDADSEAEQLRSALCDLRHFADAKGLDFTLSDKTAQQFYLAEKAG